MKKSSGKINLFVFLNIEEKKLLEMWLRLIAIFDLRKHENKGSLDFWIKVCCKNVFVILWLFACFLFLNNKTKIKLTEQGK